MIVMKIVRMMMVKMLEKRPKLFVALGKIDQDDEHDSDDEDSEDNSDEDSEDDGGEAEGKATSTLCGTR